MNGVPMLGRSVQASSLACKPQSRLTRLHVVLALCGAAARVAAGALVDPAGVGGEQHAVLVVVGFGGDEVPQRLCGHAGGPLMVAGRGLRTLDENKGGS